MPVLLTMRLTGTSCAVAVLNKQRACVAHITLTRMGHGNLVCRKLSTRRMSSMASFNTHSRIYTKQVKVPPASSSISTDLRWAQTTAVLS